MIGNNSAQSSESNRLKLVHDRRGWATTQDYAELRAFLERRGVRFVQTPVTPRKSTFYLDRYQFLSSRRIGNRKFVPKGLNFFHGNELIDDHSQRLFDRLIEKQEELDVIRVSHTAMATYLREIDVKTPIVRIPLTVDTSTFRPPTLAERYEIRQKLGLPPKATVIGSFQKDGVGWRRGDEPKLIKGPDIFVSAMRAAKNHIPNLFVLLTGPSRGFVSNRLSDYGISFRWVQKAPFSRVPDFYKALDAYVVTSRDEGGPKAVLEAMATGTPLVSTPTGQILDMDLTGAASRVCSSFRVDEVTDQLVELIANTSHSEKKESRKIAEYYTIDNFEMDWRFLFSQLRVNLL